MSDSLPEPQNAGLAFEGLTFDREHQTLSIATGTSFEEWSTIGPTLDEIDRCSKMWLGDWLVWGVREFGEEAYQMVDADMADQSLRDLEWVCREVPPDLRSASQSFAHYKVVAPMAQHSERRHWLKKALDGGWSGRELRRKRDQMLEPEPDDAPRQEDDGMMPDESDLKRIDPDTGEILTPDEIVQADGLSRVVIVITGTDPEAMERCADKLATAGAGWLERNAKGPCQIVVQAYDGSPR